MSVILHPDYRRRLREFWKAHETHLRLRISVAALKTAMGAPFSWRTLDRALRGQPVSEATRAFIVQWLDRHSPEGGAAPVRDYKSAAANDAEEETRTVRGSR